MSRRTLTLLAGTATIGLLAGGCATTDPAGGKSAAGATDSSVVAAFTSDVNTFDPAKGSAASDYLGAGMLYETLVVAQGDDILPGLATKWTQTPTKATFTIRDDVSCSNGETLTPKMIAAALRYFADPETAASAAPKAFGHGKVTVSSNDKAGTVTITLSEPWSEMLHGLTGVNAGIPCSLDPKKLAAGMAPGTGPYTLTKAQHGVGYTFTSRKNYWGGPKWDDAPQGHRPHTLKVRVIENESTAANELKAGNLDTAYFTGPDGQRFSSGGYHSIKSPVLDFLIMFNQRPGHPTAKKSVREAVAAALVPDKFNNAAALGQGKRLTSIMSKPGDCVLEDPSLLPTPDAKAAKAALSGVKLKVEGTNAVAGGAGNEYVQAALRKAGANVTLKNTDNATWAADTMGSAGDWDVNVFPHINSRHSLIGAAGLFLGEPAPKGSNVGAVHNETFANAVDGAMSTVDPKKKCEYWSTAQKALLKNVDVVPMVSALVTYVFTDGVDALAPGGGLSLATLKVEK